APGGDHEGVQHWDGAAWTIAVTRQFRDPNIGWYPGLYDIAGTSKDDLWVVGSAAAGPLVEHWNGRALREVRIPPTHFAAQGNSWLEGVAVLSRNDVWAVGFGIEHWNGKRWTRVALFKPADDLHGLSALSATDMWAVGDSRILHYSCRR